MEESGVAMNMVQRIDIATEEQSAATEEVTHNMERISEITKKSAGSARQIGSASADLAKLTSDLKGMISFFKGTPAEAEALVKKAIAYIKEHGREKGFAEISNPKGQFVNRDLIIFVYDLNGVCLAHGRDSKLIGQNQIDRKDPNGVCFIRERIETAKRQGKGWQDSPAINAVSKKIEDRVTYFELLDNFTVGSGAFK